MDIGTILNAISPEIFTLVIATAIGAAGYLYQRGVQRLPASMRAQVQGLADTVAQAVEQKYRAGSPGGALKKQEAMTMLSDICQVLKLPLDSAHASAAIEAAVYTMNLFQKKQPDSATTQVQEKPEAKAAG